MCLSDGYSSRARSSRTPGNRPDARVFWGPSSAGWVVSEGDASVRAGRKAMPFARMKCRIPELIGPVVLMIPTRNSRCRLIGVCCGVEDGKLDSSVDRILRLPLPAARCPGRHRVANGTIVDSRRSSGAADLRDRLKGAKVAPAASAPSSRFRHIVWTSIHPSRG